MKNLLLSAIALFSSVLLYSQGVGINPNGAQPDPSAMLDVTSNSAGILIPRMTQSERDAIQTRLRDYRFTIPIRIVLMYMLAQTGVSRVMSVIFRSRSWQ